MKYNILLNQKSAIDIFDDNLSFEDLIVLEFIKDFILSWVPNKVEILWKIYYWVKYSHILEQLPLLKISDKTLKRIIENLITNWALEKAVVENNSTYFSLTEKTLSMYFDGLDKMGRADKKDIGGIPNLSDHIIYINNNKKTDTKKDQIKEEIISLDGKTEMLSNIAVEQAIEIWNSVNLEIWKKVKVRNWSVILSNITRAYNAIKNKYTKDEFYNWLENYIGEIKNRKPSNNPWDYYYHRFTFFEFISQGNWLQKFAFI